MSDQLASPTSAGATDAGQNDARSATQNTLPHNEPIAIVGIGCRLPGGADNPARLWALLQEGFDAIGPIPAERFDVDALFAERPATPGHIMSRWGGYLSGIDQFDADFFGISPREAERLDPQQRLLLEVTWEALEDAGLPPNRLAGTQTGVYVGLWLNDFEARLFADPDNLDLYMTTGSGRYSASGRLSYFLDLMGPSITIDTACSSSLVAVHLACQSLRSGESAVAIAGGANVILQPHITIAYSQSRMMAPDGHCKFGDARADGYVRSDGAAMVVLKRLSTALADGDSIYALIRGGAVTNDGRSSGFLATPGQAGQAEMLRRAYANANVDPASVHYVEAHGTGTSAGDPVELGALGEVLGVGRPADKPLLVGSIKTNMGHTEGAAGVAGLIKTALALKHRHLPASLHQQTPNPAIAWDDLRLRVNATARPFPADATPARAGVSAFGIAGTNAHIVLEEAQAVAGVGAPVPAARRAEEVDCVHVLPLSARTHAALRALAARYRDLLAAEAARLDAICWSAATRRQHLEQRLALAARTPAEAIEALDAFLAGGDHAALATGVAADAAPRVAFVFPGQGGQWQGMARDFLAQEPVFRQSMQACDAAIRAVAGWSLLERLESNDSAWLERIDEVQPALFALQVALATLWQTWGIAPAAVVGHSLGEVAAAHVAGALNLADAARIICLRSQLLRRVAGLGAMAVVGLTVDEAQAALADYSDRVSVAVSNSAQSTVISGEPAAVDAILAALQARNVFCRRVNVDVASHSPQMEPLAAELHTMLADVQPAAATIPFYSTVTARAEAGDTLAAEYWARNLRRPVRFAEGMGQMVDDGCTVFVEIGPHPVLVTAIEENLRQRGVAGAAVASLRREANGPLTMRAALGILHTVGAPVAWQALENGGITPLPTYPWQREHHWLEVAASAQHRGRADHWLLGWPLALAGRNRVWENRLTAATHPLAYAHRLGTLPVLPAAAAVDAALAAAQFVSAEAVSAEAVSIDLSLTHLVVLDDDAPTSVQISATTNPTGATDIRAFTRSTDAWLQTAHATALRAPALAHTQPDANLQSMETLRREGESMSGAALYARLEQAGVQIAPSLRRVEWLWRRGDEILAEIAAADAEQAGQLLFEPALEVAALAVMEQSADTQAQWMPVAATGIALHAPAAARMWCHVRVLPDAGLGATVARLGVELLGANGAAIASVAALEMQQFDNQHGTAAQIIHTVTWHAAPLAADAPALPQSAAPWLILADNSGVGDALAALMQSGGLRTVVAYAGAAYAQVTDNRYTLRVDASDDFAHLLAEAFAATPPAGVIYLWGLDTPETAPLHAQSLEQTQAQLTGGLLRLVQQLLAAALHAPVHIVTRGAQPVGDSLAPPAIAQTALWGLGRTLAEELPNLHGALIDLDPAAAADACAQALGREMAAFGAESQVALRGADRFVPRLVHLDTQEAPPPLHLRSDGAYLLTGAFGGIGSHLARWLVDHGTQRLILMGRTQLPPRAAWATVDPASSMGKRVALVRELEHKGASVHIAALDVGDEDALRGWLTAYAAEGWPAIRGVIHMAALFDGALMHDMDPNALPALLRPKLLGGWLLSELLPNVDLFVLFSSLAALLPQPGQGAYAAANTFLDALAHSRAARGQAALSVNWGVWAIGEEGTTAEYRQRTAMADQLLASTGFRAFRLAEGLNALGLLLQQHLLQATVAPFDGRVLAATLASRSIPFLAALALPDNDEQASSDRGGHASLHAQLESAEPAERIHLMETHVRQVVARVLRMQAERMDPTRVFTSMGMDSLMGVELRNRLEVDLGLRLPATLAWNYPTVKALSSHLLAMLQPGAGGADHAASPQPARPPAQEPDNQATDNQATDNTQLATLVANVQELSDDDVLSALLKGVQA